MYNSKTVRLSVTCHCIMLYCPVFFLWWCQCCHIHTVWNLKYNSSLFLLTSYPLLLQVFLSISATPIVPPSVVIYSAVSFLVFMVTVDHFVPFCIFTLCDRCFPTFWRHVLPLSSGWLNVVQLYAEVVGRKRNVSVMWLFGGNLAKQSYGRTRRIGLVWANGSQFQEWSS